MSFLCPKCHASFKKEVLKREPLLVWGHSPEHFDEPDLHPTRSCPSSVDTSKEVAEFMHYCKCKHCGHEWTEVKAIEFDK